MKSETFRLNKIFIFETSKYSNIKILQNEVHLSKNYAIYLVIRSKFRLNFFWDAERVKWDFNRVDWKKSETLAMSSAKEYVPGIVTCQRAETLYRCRINEFLAIYLYQRFVMVKGIRLLPGSCSILFERTAKLPPAFRGEKITQPYLHM